MSSFDLTQFTQYFDNPKVSVFNRSCKKDFDMRIGPWYPAKWDLASFGNSAKGSSGHKMRLAPLLAPTFSDLRVQEHTGVVPLRVIMDNYEQTFNFATNRDGASLPHFTYLQYKNLCRAMLLAGIPLEGSLLDFLGFPTFSYLYKIFLENYSSFYFETRSNQPDYIRITPDQMLSYDQLVPFLDVNTGGFVGTYSYRGAMANFGTSVSSRSDVPVPLIGWLIQRMYGSFILPNVQDFYLKLPSLRRAVILNEGQTTFDPFLSVDPSKVPTIEEIISVSPFETVDSMIKAYQLYLYSFMVERELRRYSASNRKVFTTLPLRAFWRLHYDWNTNGNFTDRDLYLSHIYEFETGVNLAATGVINHSDFDNSASILRQWLTVPNRLWDFDYFTSLLPTAAADDAIEIPANSTVLDLAKLTALQKFALRLSYSSRYRDVVWNIFKIKPSDARLQQSSIIRQKTHNVGIGETLQTSETTTSSVLGQFAGRGISSGNNKGYHIFCEEPCVIIDFVSLVPSASYQDALHPLIHTDDILDFPIPDMDVLGNQPVYSDLVTGDPQDDSTVIGFGRQYQEWLYNYNTVHGEFKTTLDYWQLSRRFSDVAVINDDFLRIHDADDFDKIFSVPNAPHAFMSIYFKSSISRHVHRSVRIQI